MRFQDAAIDSARIYYQHLDTNGCGLAKTEVDRIEKSDDIFVLHLKSRMAFSEDIQIRIHNKDFTQEQIFPIEYDEIRRMLRIRPKAEYVNEIAACSPDDIVIVSDLKFLVKRVEAWYEEHGEQLCIPSRKPDVQYHAFPNLQQQPSEEQTNAINGVLSSPFSYVWGAPGTGKTRCVLARCVLAYIMAGKKVLITAPTNNAVEQMLYGVLSVLEEANVPVEHVLRLGLASTEFMKRYPSVCEDMTHSNRLLALKKQIQADHCQQKENDRLLSMLSEGAVFKCKADRFRECAMCLFPFFDDLRNLRRQDKALNDSAILLNGEYRWQEGQLKKEKAEHEKATSKIHKLNMMVAKYSHGVRSIFLKRKHARYLEELKHALDDAKCRQREIETQSQKLQSISDEQQRNEAFIQNNHAEILRCRNKIDKLTAFWPELHTIALKATDQEDMSAELSQMEGLIQQCEETIHRKEQKYKEIEDLSEQELLIRKERLKQELEQHQNQLEEAEKQSTAMRIKEVTVLAATVDRCIKDLPPNDDFTFFHVFLDEAGYCSLIKAATLMAYDCPLTFMGDHMQLSPVCEMDDKKMENDNRLVALWAQSALYAEDTMNLTPDQVCTAYFDHAAARFREMKKFCLTHTYRFGESLARVLESEVYTEGFSGDPNCNTEIYCLRINRVRDEKKRTSSEECRAIIEYCQNMNESDIGIITPYRAQRDLLKRKLSFSNSLSDAVMTVHGSQGREWDVVLFSVVDTTQKWFTDSTNAQSNGKRVINTAVSRARKKLILVCDADYWQTQKKQLIGKLLTVAQVIDM